MRTILVDNAWPKIAKATKADHGRRHLAVAYATELHTKLKRGDILVTNTATATIATGETSAKLLLSLHRKGVEVYGLDGLHAKLGVLGRHAVIGSANLSLSSANDLHEAMLITTDDAIRAQVLATVTGLKEAAVRLDEKALIKLAKVKVVRRGGGSRKTRKLIGDAGSRTWLVGGKILTRITRKTQEIVDQGVEEVIRLTKDNDYEPSWFSTQRKTPLGRWAKPGDRLVQIIRHDRGVDVYPPQAIIHCERSSKRFIAFLDPEDDRMARWRDFSSWAKRSGVRLSKGANRQLSDREVLALATFDGWLE